MTSEYRAVWPTREQIEEDREWFQNWRDGMFSSTSRDKDGWPMEMHGLVARLEQYLDAWDAAPADAAEAVDEVFRRKGLPPYTSDVLRALGMPDPQPEAT